MTELHIQPIIRLAKLIRDRRVSPVEVLQACLYRIDKFDLKLNAIVTLAPDAIEKAKEAEAGVMRGDALGPLHGVPVTIKDTIETAGLRTTSGSMLRAEFVPAHDALAVARLKSAGAIILGKTNAAEMAMDYTADNPVFGRTNNPYDLSLTPGGSSGGEAAAIASCMSPGGIGSDLAGSIRIPAHFCGIAGLKPGTGRVPGAGQFPESIGPYSLGSVIGPMARTIEDLQLLFSVLASSKNSHRSSEVLEQGRLLLRGSHAAVYAEDGAVSVTEETHIAVMAVANALAQAGLIV